ncbi:MAG: hypothetical protein K6T31_09590 [Alicyclobacillus sp.]|nr:hypothetical protein [Alicyclobacillus sp.]
MDRAHPLYLILCIAAALALQAVLLWKLRGSMERASSAEPPRPDRESP